jgi:hypothetical protein
MNFKEALKLDRGLDAYVDYDNETQMYGVFGCKSNFCYSLHTDYNQALLSAGALTKDVLSVSSNHSSRK